MDVVIAQARRNMPVCAFPETGSGMNILCPRFGNRHGRLPQSAHFKIAPRPVEPATFKLRFRCPSTSPPRFTHAPCVRCTSALMHLRLGANTPGRQQHFRHCRDSAYNPALQCYWSRVTLDAYEIIAPLGAGEWANSHVGAIIRASMPSKGEGRSKQTGLLYCLVCCLAYCTWIVNEEDAGAPGLVATRVPVPAAVRSDAGMATVTWVGSTMVVVR